MLRVMPMHGLHGRAFSALSRVPGLLEAVEVFVKVAKRNPVEEVRLLDADLPQANLGAPRRNESRLGADLGVPRHELVEQERGACRDRTPLGAPMSRRSSAAHNCMLIHGIFKFRPSTSCRYVTHPTSGRR